MLNCELLVLAVVLDEATRDVVEVVDDDDDEDTAIVPN